MRHYPPANQPLVGKHSAKPECPCKPQKIVKRRQATSGRGGRHQGYHIDVSYQHNYL